MDKAQPAMTKVQAKQLIKELLDFCHEVTKNFGPDSAVQALPDVLREIREITNLSWQLPE